MSRCFIGLVVSLSLSIPAFSQAGNGEINGSVVDSSGAVVSGAAVTISHPTTGLTRVIQTNSEGLYSVPALQPGVYSVKAEMTGFQSQIRSDIELQVGQIAKIDFTLQIGNVSEVVEVTGGAPV